MIQGWHYIQWLRPNGLAAGQAIRFANTRGRSKPCERGGRWVTAL
ncbi:hypothetical protein TPY_2145 [Sulfobacillus acidophilus TPY]|nr:hypothetical protein TPY_2145 [Sulfobacillus acidophilus TPY]